MVNISRRSRMTMLIGLPASGKSYLANQFSENSAVVISSDSVRSELYPDWYKDYSIVDNAKVFDEVNHRVRDSLISGKDVVFDATNLKAKSRRNILNFVNATGCEKYAIVMATPYDICQKYNLIREHSVPAEYIKNVYRNFQFPLYSEGLDNISIEIRDDIYSSDLPNFSQVMFGNNGLVNYDQHNKNHSMTLGNHLLATHNYIVEHYPDEDRDVCFAGLFHDIGKPQTCAFTDIHGNPTEDAHYYNHQYTSAYETMLYLMNPQNRCLGFVDNSDSYEKNMQRIVHICQLVSCHMAPYFWKERSTKENYRKRWGDKFYNEIIILHEADRKSHTQKLETVSVRRK